MRKKTFISPTESSSSHERSSSSSSHERSSSSSSHERSSSSSSGSRTRHCPSHHHRPKHCPGFSCDSTCREVLNRCLYPPTPPPPIVDARVQETIETQQIDVLYTTMTTIDYVNWISSVRVGYTQAAIGFEAVIDITSLNIRLVNQTTNQILGVLSGISASGFYQMPFTLPTANARLAIEVSKSAGLGSNPQIFGISMLLQ